jgi:hypothetical protein
MAATIPSPIGAACNPGYRVNRSPEVDAFAPLARDCITTFTGVDATARHKSFIPRLHKARDEMQDMEWIER